MRTRQQANCLRSAEQGLYYNILPKPDFEEMTDDVLLRLSKLRDGLALDHKNIAACRVDEAIEIVLNAYRSLGESNRG